MYVPCIVYNLLFRPINVNYSIYNERLPEDDVNTSKYVGVL